MGTGRNVLAKIRKSSGSRLARNDGKTLVREIGKDGGGWRGLIISRVFEVAT